MMEALLGLPLEQARAMLEEAGKTVLCTEIRSRKGVMGADAPRVIRVRESGDGVELIYAIFQTSIDEKN